MVILIAEDQAALRASLATYLSVKHEVIACEDGLKALEVLKSRVVDLLITDIQMPGLDGLGLVRQVKESSPSTAFLMMTAHGTVEQAVEAIRLGAEDYLLKPFDLSELDHRLARIEDLGSWKAEQELKTQSRAGAKAMLGLSANIREANEFVTKVGGVPSPVLILGASGSGKEVMAKAIHACGPRANRPFIAINCASLSENLIESELFGHEKGAFTGAAALKPGKFELARGGTIFLDEIGELSPSVQARLLRVLQEREFYRVGGTRLIKSDARVIAATHRPLKKMAQAGTFREDLFFRLSVLTFELQPLRSRPEDIAPLVEMFWERFNRECGRNLKMSGEVLARLKAYDYPGNVRELQNLLERLVVLGGEAGTVSEKALPPELRDGAPAVASPSATSLRGLGLNEEVEALEKRLMTEALDKTGGNQAKAADLLKINRGSFHYKMKKYGFTGASEDEAA